MDDITISLDKIIKWINWNVGEIDLVHNPAKFSLEENLQVIEKGLAPFKGQGVKVSIRVERLS